MTDKSSILHTQCHTLALRYNSLSSSAVAVPVTTCSTAPGNPISMANRSASAIKTKPFSEYAAISVMACTSSICGTLPSISSLVKWSRSRDCNCRYIGESKPWAARHPMLMMASTRKALRDVTEGRVSWRSQKMGTRYCCIFEI